VQITEMSNSPLYLNGKQKLEHLTPKNAMFHRWTKKKKSRAQTL